MTVTVDEVLDKLYFSATDERDKGDKLERLMTAYLRTEPEHATRFSQVWRWMDRTGASTLRPTATIEADGHIRVDGQLHPSPTGAAQAARGDKRSVNGWRYWRYGEGARSELRELARGNGAPPESST